MDKKLMLVTQTLKLKDVHPDAADTVAKEHNLDPEDVLLVRKGITPTQFELKEGERAVISYITTGAVDRDREIVEPSGAILTDYLKHPVVLFGHDYKKLPIGKNEWIKFDSKGLIAKTVYATHDEAEKVYQYRKAGFPLAESIGFVPLEYEDLDEQASKAAGGARRRYTKWMMLEYSDVAVPSNPEALQIAISKGLVPETEQNKTVIPYSIHGDSTKAAETVVWNGPEEIRKATPEQLKKMSAWYDSENPENKSSYKLPHHMVDGNKVVWRGVVAAMAALLGSRGGVNIPAGDRKGVYNHLAKHYDQFDKPVPEFKEYSDEELIEKAGRVISQKNRTLIEQAISALQTLLQATEPEAEKSVEVKAIEELEEVDLNETVDQNTEILDSIREKVLNIIDILK